MSWGRRIFAFGAKQRAMYRRLGAPVEKVLQFFTEFQARLDSKKDNENVRWMMEVIAADNLYNVGGYDEDTLRNLQERLLAAALMLFEHHAVPMRLLT